MTLNLQNEWVVFDNEESLIYTSKVREVTFVVQNALRSYARGAFAEGRHFKDVLLKQGEVKFNVWVNQLPVGYEPLPGDTFTDAENFKWVVYQADIDTLRSRYRLSCYEAK